MTGGVKLRIPTIKMQQCNNTAIIAQRSKLYYEQNMAHVMVLRAENCVISFKQKKSTTVETHGQIEKWPATLKCPLKNCL